MTDPNYDYHDDFHGEDPMKEFLDEVFKEVDERPEPPICRNIDCVFTENVIAYLFMEWELDVAKFSHELQEKVMDAIDDMKGHYTGCRCGAAMAA